MEFYLCECYSLSNFIIIQREVGVSPHYGSCCEVFMPTWYPTVVAMVRITTTKVIAAWLAIVELLKILVHESLA